MPLKIVRDNIINIYADAIVNSANPSPVIGQGVDYFIHKSAGPKLLEERKQIGCIQVGEAKITLAYHLKAEYVIHTVGPKWIDGKSGEKENLSLCYKNSLQLAKEKNCHSIAFPLLSSGFYGIPKDVALQIAIDSIQEFLEENEMLVYLVVFDKKSYQISKTLSNSVSSYIDEHYIAEIKESAPAFFKNSRCREEVSNIYYDECEEDCLLSPSLDSIELIVEEKLENTFSEELFNWIIKKDLSDVYVYKKANMDRKLFSKIRNNKNYKPSKINAIALAIALELTLEETKDFIGKAGYALTHSSKFDIIIEYFIVHNNYNIFDINEVLFDYDLPLIGG